MKVMCGTLKFETDVIRFRHASGVAKVPLMTKGMHKNASLTDQLTTDQGSNGNGEEVDDRMDETESSSTEILVLNLRKD